MKSPTVDLCVAPFFLGESLFAAKFAFNQVASSLIRQLTYGPEGHRLRTLTATEAHRRNYQFALTGS